MHKSYRYILIFIVILGFALRLKICHELLLADPNVLNPLSLTDMSTYITLAHKIAQGLYWEPFYFQPFYYVVFLGGIFFIFGTNIFYVLFFQSFLSALTILFTALSAKILWNKKTAVIAALLLLFSQALSFYTSFLLIATLQSFWISLILYLTLITFKKGKNIYWIFIGFITGCSILTRGNMWLFVPVLFFLAIYFSAKQRKPKNKSIIKYLVPIVLLLLFTVIPQLPFAYINSKIQGTLSGPSLASKVSLTYGNTPESPPSANGPDFGAGIISLNPTQKYWLSTAGHTSISKRILQYIKEKPLSYLELTFRKLLLFWDYREIPNNVDINMERLLSPTLKYFGFLTTAILMVLAIPGILVYFPLLSGDKRKFLVPFLFTLAYWFSISLVIILSRYRAPIIPLLALYAAGFINFIFFEKINNIKKLVCILLIFFSAFVVYSSYDFYRFNIESKVIRQIIPHGISVNMKEKTMYLDNGPMIFGSWDLTLLHSGDTIIKEFSTVPTSKTSLCSFQIPFISDTPVKATVIINGKLFHISSNKPGIIKEKFNIPVSNSESANSINKKLITIKIDIRMITGKLYCIIDKQRTYDRTIINNKTVNAELVCRLFL